MGTTRLTIDVHATNTFTFYLDFHNDDNTRRTT